MGKINLERRRFALGFAAVAGSIAGCGGGGNSPAVGAAPPPTPAAAAPPALPVPPAVALKITSVSPTTPYPRTAVYLSTQGLDATHPYTVTVSNAANTLTLTPIRTQTDGTVVVAVPLILDPLTGLTAASSMNFQITQGAHSDAVAVSVLDLPSSSSYGATPGQISRGFLNYLAISLAQKINHYQALAAMPTSKTNTSNERATLLAQLKKTIETRNNVDLIVSGKHTQLIVGATPSGVKLPFNAASIEVMDRTIAIYLQVIGYLPSTPGSLGIGAKRALPQQRALSDTYGAAAGGVLTAITTLGALAQIPALVGGLNGAVTPITGKPGHTTADNVIAGLQVAAVAVTLLTIGTEAAVAASIFGAVVGVAAVGMDLMNIATSDAGFPGASKADYVKLVADAIGGFAALGTGVKAAGVLLEGNMALIAAESLAAPFGAGSIDLVYQGGGFVSGVAGLSATLGAFGASAIESGSAPVGEAIGVSTVTNSAGPILSGLSGVFLTDPGTGKQFTTLADDTGNYMFEVPLNVPGFNYSGVQIATYDPVTNSGTGPATTADLSALTPAAPRTLPPVAGQCSDDDAGNPDKDDPDCD